MQLLNKLKAPNHFTTHDEEALEGFCNIVGLAMQNAITFDAVREKEETTSHILSSISSYICKARGVTTPGVTTPGVTTPGVTTPA